MSLCNYSEILRGSKMKITKRQLRRIIKEELENSDLNEFGMIKRMFGKKEKEEGEQSQKVSGKRRKRKPSAVEQITGDKDKKLNKSFLQDYHKLFALAAQGKVDRKILKDPNKALMAYRYVYSMFGDPLGNSFASENLTPLAMRDDYNEDGFGTAGGDEE